MAWFALIIAGLFEVAWATAMKQSDGFTRPWPTVVTAVAAVASFVLLAGAMRSLPLGTAYAVWTGIGTLGAFVLGIALLGEPAGWMRIVAALMIVGGIVLMKLSSPE